MKRKTKVRPPMPSWRGLANSLLVGLLLLLVHDASAQAPQFRKWNVGVVEGSSPMNAGTWFPSLRGHYGRFSLEAAPSVFCLGAGVTYHQPMYLFKQRVKLSLDATAYGARTNNKYFVVVPDTKYISNHSDLGLLIGPSFYFLKRMSLQTMLGYARVAPYGEQPFGAYPRFYYFSEQAAISLEIKLFNTFQQ